LAPLFHARNRVAFSELIIENPREGDNSLEKPISEDAGSRQKQRRQTLKSR
jgi:hypothetical protein